MANGNESFLSLTTQGGTAYGASVWLDDELLGSWAGNSSASTYTQQLRIPTLSNGEHHVLTVIVDQMGYEENIFVGADLMKSPRGILDYEVSGHGQADISWRMTGNLGGEKYRDVARGPLNEGSMFAERQGYHLPAAPFEHWAKRSPLQGISGAGIGFFYTSFALDLPEQYDVPISVVFGNASLDNGGEPSNYRCQLFVNGYQMGKYSKFPRSTNGIRLDLCGADVFQSTT